MAGERFTKRVLEPMSPISVLMLVQAGWPIDMVWPTMVSSVNGLHSQSLGVAADARCFVELQQVLGRIQQSHAVGFRLRNKDEGDALLMVVHREHVPQVASDLKQMRQLLGLQPGSSQFVVTFGEVPRNDKKMAINTRSMLEVLQGSWAPASTCCILPRQAKVQPFVRATPEEGESEYQPLVNIRFGRTALADTPYAAIPHKGYWFWIEDDDHRSKRLFSFLMMLFSLAETGQPAAPLRADHQHWPLSATAAA
ncbi:MAG: hypothetical protein U1F55_09025 [Chitinivorax sp.]